MEILKVHSRKDNVKYVIIPKGSKINSGDYIVVSNDMNFINKIKKEEKNGWRRKKTT